MRPGGLLDGYSIEVTPDTLADADIRHLLPPGTEVYVAHIAGTPPDAMVSTARRLHDAGLMPRPHVPARSLSGAAELDRWLRRYRDEAGVDRLLLLAGDMAQPRGPFSSSMDLVETGLPDLLGFRDLAFAGHPEGSKVIDPDGGSALVDAALHWKQAFSLRSDATARLVTQFAFDAGPVIAWAERIAAAGIGLPVHVGLAGPATLPRLIRFGMVCGVGPSLKVLQRRARDLRHLLRPYAPDDMVARLSQYRKTRPESLIAGIHLFPVGGLAACVEWADKTSAAADG